VIAIEAFRTLLESMYFGAWYTSYSEILPISIYNFLIQSHILFIPKVINLVAAFLVFYILLRKWLPCEEEERRRQLDQIDGLEKEIAERKKTEEALRLTQFAMDNAGDACYWIREDASIFYVNKAACNMLDYTREELLSMLVTDLDPNFPIGGWEKHWEKSRRKGTYMVETAHRRRNGEIVPIEVHVNFVMFEGEEYHCSFVRDITERKKVEESLRASEERYKSMFSNSHAVMMLIDPETDHIEDVNPAACNYYGYSRDDLLRMKISNINILPAEKIHELMKKVRSKGRRQLSLKHRLADGEIRDVEIYSGPIVIKGKELLFSIIHDITERKRAEEELQRYAETQAVLLQEVNHRVKNNLSALISILQMEGDRAEVVYNSEYIELLNDLISRINGLSTVHSMLSASQWRDLNLADLCKRVIENARKGVNLDRRIIANISPSDVSVNSDQSHHLSLVINELFTNSVKHAGEGKQNLVISIDISEDDNIILIEYKDNGPGYREGTVIRNDDKTGIGLTLIKGIIEQSMDGEVLFSGENGAEAIIKIESSDNEKGRGDDR
jgi:PAS domain S-box-containing protein